MKMFFSIACAFSALLLGNCKSGETVLDESSTTNTIENVVLTTNKAVYSPGDTVWITSNKALPSDVKIRYKYLGDVLKEENYSATTWKWIPAANDFKGYMVDAYHTVSGTEEVVASIAVDVSSDWTRFPRYGFLSLFSPSITDGEINTVISDLSRHHINGLQYYDWHYKHHKPLAGTPSAPLATWLDIMNRTTSKSTLQKYIVAAKSQGMKSMFYNLAYGALDDAASDGVKDAWYIFTDKNKTTRDVCDLPQPAFKSDIYLVNPANTAWQTYIATQNADVYAVYNFDGYHIDQLGDRGTVYDYSGNVVSLEKTFQPFIAAMKSAAPTKRLIMNAVNQYGQEGGIASSDVDFLYSEVWSPNESFSSLANVIQNNDTYSSQTKKTMLAAYMNYNVANSTGTFNTPAVLLCDAVIFSFGGAHLELGEHMLCKEYFPNANLSMQPALKKALIHYYDFLTGYQNILRDGGSFNDVTISCTNGKIQPAMWPPQTGKVAVVGKKLDSRQVIHLINFTNAAHFEWRDTNGTQTTPNTISDIALSISASQTVKKVWVASPDWNNGVATAVDFTQNVSKVSFSLPYLQYWTTIVFEY
jgi:dextranase